jgi:hypothetical protein
MLVSSIWVPSKQISRPIIASGWSRSEISLLLLRMDHRL